MSAQPINLFPRFVGACRECRAVRFSIKIFLLLLFSVSASPTRAQIQSGTIVVLGLSRDKVVIAADSRATRITGEHSDSACKVRALGDRLVFVSVGALAFRPRTPLDDGWSADDAARRAFQSFKSNGWAFRSALVNGVSERWASAMISNLSHMRPDPTWRDGEVVARGLFAGIEATEEIGFRVINLVYRPGQPEKWASLTEFETLRNPETAFRAFGKTEIVNEFLSQVTERAMIEAIHWKAELTTHRLEDRDLLTAIRLVDLTLAYFPGTNVVGGNIDAVELSRRGIRWKQKKYYCQDY